MSFIGTIAARIAADARHAATAPVRAGRDSRRAIEGLLAGEVSPTQVLSTLLWTLLATGVVALLLFPIYWVFMLALEGATGSLFAVDLHLFPQQPTLKTFVWVLGDLIVPSYRVTVGGFGYEVFLETPRVVLLDASAHGVEYPSDFTRYFWNSVTVAVPTVILAMCAVIPGAYALSRRRFFGRSKLLYGYVLFTQVGGGLGIASLVALYALFVKVGIDANKLALSAYYAATAIPFNTWLLKTYMDGIPTSYEEAARVDGAPAWRIVTEVVLPLSRAGLATVLIFTFLAGWTEFIVANSLLSTEQSTLPVGLYLLVDERSTPWPKFSAFALLFALPIMVVYLLAQRYIEEGLSFSGVEG